MSMRALTTTIAVSIISSGCTPSFQSKSYRTSSSSSSSIGKTGSIIDSPVVLMSAQQTYDSMKNLTGLQSTAVTNNSKQEYAARFGQLPAGFNIGTYNAPVQLAALSLAGQLCDDLLRKEMPMVQADRKFFKPVNFNTSLSANGEQAYRSVASVMAQSFWGRDVSVGETTILDGFYNDFVAEGTNTANTRKYYLALCSTMLSALDSITY